MSNHTPWKGVVKIHGHVVLQLIRRHFEANIMEHREEVDLITKMPYVLNKNRNTVVINHWENQIT